MRNVFDEAAGRFSRSIDSTIAKGQYLRGSLFIERARSTIAAGGYVLDYGCGPGRISVLLARSGYRVLGADTSEGMIAQARALDRDGLDIDFTVLDGAADVLRPDTYDGIVCSSVIEYVPDPRGLLEGFHRALREEGTLIISFANKASLCRRFAAHSRNPMLGSHHHADSWRGFRKLLSESGFRQVGWPRFFESPYDWRRIGLVLGRAPFIGTLGIVVARREAAAPAGPG